MGVFDDVMQTLNDGADTVRGVASNVLVERASFVRGFVRMCDDGWRDGWHERNGGNLTYRMTADEAGAVCRGFDAEPGVWMPMGVSVPELAGGFFLVTGAGRYMRNVKDDPAANIGIVELDPTGSAYRVVWGLAAAGRPTSELPTHLMTHAVRMRASRGDCRVIYHAHPCSIVAMTSLLPLDSRTFSRALWKAMTECAMVFPSGVGVLPWMVPGGDEIAKATAGLMEEFDAVVWAQHGVFATGESYDAAFGLMHTIEKAAGIYCLARSANGGSDAFANTIDDAGLRCIGKRYGVRLNEAFLDA